MSPDSPDSPLEKHLPWPLRIETLVYKDMHTKVFGDHACSGRERELRTCPSMGKGLKNCRHTCPVEYWETIRTAGLRVCLLIEERKCARRNIKWGEKSHF